MLTVAIIIYAAAMTLANLSIAHFGPWISPINAFVLIGLDLALRDWLHVRLRPWQMLALIASAGAITFVLNPAAGKIAVASSVAFTAAALVDWATFARLKGSWLFRANGSNVAGAAVDSLIFPTLAFGVLMPQIVAMQFIAKVAGGSIWAWIISHSAIKRTA
jgi:queuosine precursor transporter